MHGSFSISRRFLGRFLTVPILCVAWGAPCFGSDETKSEWAQFRGPRVDGKASRVPIPPNSFRLEPTWNVEIGSGYSSLSIAEGKVVTGGTNGTDDFFLCLSEETGKELWRQKIGPMYAGHDGSHDGPISTPTIHDGRVFGLGPWGKLMALDLETGTVLWSKELPRIHGAPKPHYGFTASPIIHGDSILLLLGAPGAAVAAFDCITGDLQWSCGDSVVAYQTAVPIEVGGKLHVLAAGMSNLLGVDPDEGRVLWDYAHGGGGGRGSGSMVPVPAGEGHVFLSHRSESSKVIQLVPGNEGKTRVENVWENRTIFNSYTVPVFRDGYLYAYSVRRLTCVNAETGERAWRSRLPGDGWVALAQDHLVVLTKEGELHIIKATPENYQPVTSTRIFSDLAWSPPSLANGHIFVRSLTSAARVAFVPDDASKDLTVASTSAASTPVASSSADSATQGFRSFIAKLGEEGANKDALITRYFSQQTSFPIVDGNQVHFVYRGEANDMAIAGDMIGARQEQRMTRAPGSDVFYYSTKLESDARVNYMFIRDYEGILDPLNPRQTATTQYGQDMEIGMPGGRMAMSWLSMPAWRKPKHLDEPSGPRGTTERHRIKSRILGNATDSLGARPGPPSTVKLTVYLPYGYSEGDQRYPVAYVHGGKMARSMGEYENTLDNLIGKTLAPVIVVFLDLSYMSCANLYDQVFGEEIVPLIDETYRTLRSREARASIGAGIDGLAAIQCGVLQPKTVSKVASQSAQIFEVFLPPIEERLEKASLEHPVSIYLEWGRYDMRNPHEAWNIGDANARYAQKLDDMGYDVERHEVNDGTGWSSWKNRTDRLLEALFPLEHQQDSR